MGEQFVVIEGIVGSNAQGFSLHQTHSPSGKPGYLATIGLRDRSGLIWQEIEMSDMQASQFDRALASGNTVRVSGRLKKQLGTPLYRVLVEDVQLISAPQALRIAA